MSRGPVISKVRACLILCAMPDPRSGGTAAKTHRRARIHEVSMPETGGPIRNRDMSDPGVLACWRALASMGLAVQMHFIPGQAPNIRALAAKFPETTVIRDHMGRPGI
jgi:predicted TIM-barrel fold metal-dependent hydrolase